MSTCKCAHPDFRPAAATPPPSTLTATERLAVSGGWNLVSFRDVVSRGLSAVLAPLTVAAKPAPEAIPDPPSLYERIRQQHGVQTPGHEDRGATHR